jgi:hypothetical protein
MLHLIQIAGQSDGGGRCQGARSLITATATRRPKPARRTRGWTESV